MGSCFPARQWPARAGPQRGHWSGLTEASHDLNGGRIRALWWLSLPRAVSPPSGGRADLAAELIGHGAHVGSRQVVSIVVYQHVSLDRRADVGAADRVAHVQRFERRELFDPVEGGVAVRKHVGALDAA